MEKDIKPDSLSESLNLQDLPKDWHELSDKLSGFFWNESTAIQTAIILVGFIIAGILYRILSKPLDNKIEKTSLPIQAKRIVTRLKKLTFPILWLLFTFTASAIVSALISKVDVKLVYSIEKVLLAWIVIRIAVQFVSNRIVRNIFATSIWIIAALSVFGILDQTAATLNAIGFNIGDFRLSALAVIKVAFSLFALLYLAIFASGFIERRVFQIKSLTRSSQVLAAKVIRVSLIVFALLIGITSSGIDLSLFAVFGGAIGLGVGFGLQKGVSNLFSGMLLLLDRSIKPGDVIEIPDIGTFGWVNEMGARYTEIVTRDNKSYLIPNEDFITQRVVNWSHGNSLIRISLDFGVHYDSDMENVVEVAKEAAKLPERVVDYRQPVCWITEFGDSSVNFTVRFWIKDAEEGITNVKGEVYMALWKAFKENDIQIPYPHREVYMHKSK